MERLRPSIEEKPQKRYRVVAAAVKNNQETALPPLPDWLVISILRLLPVATQLRVIPLVSRAWNKLLWASVIEVLELRPFRDRMNDAIACRLLSKCVSLRTLSLKHCSVTDEVTTHLPPNLKELELTWCNRLSSDALRSLPSIELLNLSWCSNIKDVSLRHLPTTLTVLQLGGCADLTDEGIKALERHPSLTSLHVSGCSQLTNRILTHLPPSLRVFEVFACPNISDEDLRVLPSRIHVLGRIWPSLQLPIPPALEQALMAARVTSLSALGPLVIPPADTLPPLQLNPTPTPPRASTAPAAAGTIPSSQGATSSSSSSSRTLPALPPIPEPKSSMKTRRTDE